MKIHNRFLKSGLHRAIAIVISLDAFAFAMILGAIACDLKRTCTPLEVSNILDEYAATRKEFEAADPKDLAAARPIIDRLLDVTERLDACIPRKK